jgi:hypothetical protein
LAKLSAAAGKRGVAAIAFEDISRWYKAARAPKTPGQQGRTRAARRVITILRIVIKFRVLMGVPHCERLAKIFASARFEVPKPRRVRLTYDQITAIIEKAHEMEAHSIALGQALQFEGLFRQEDVTGQWRPLTDGESVERGLVAGRRLWTNGLTWSDLDERFSRRRFMRERSGAT